MISTMEQQWSIQNWHAKFKWRFGSSSYNNLKRSISLLWEGPYRIKGRVLEVTNFNGIHVDENQHAGGHMDENEHASGHMDDNQLG